MSSVECAESDTYFPTAAVAAAACGEDLQNHPGYAEGIAEVASFLVGREVAFQDAWDLLPHAQTAIMQQYESSRVSLPGTITPDTMHTWLSFQPDCREIDGVYHTPLSPIRDPEVLADIDLKQANDQVHMSLIGTVLAYHVQTRTPAGKLVQASSPYGIREGDSFPFMDGKAEAAELQAELDRLVAESTETGEDPGIRSDAALKEYMRQKKLGVDCSNFVFRYLSGAYERLGLPGYSSSVFRDATETLELFRSGRWHASDENGSPRELTTSEISMLERSERIPVSWISQVRNRAPAARMTGAAHICAEDATVAVPIDDLRPGDIVAFYRPGSNRVARHVGAVHEIDALGDDKRVTIWHSREPRDAEPGVGSDFLLANSAGEITGASRDALIDPSRYHIEFRRANEIAQYYESIRARHLN